MEVHNPVKRYYDLMEWLTKPGPQLVSLRQLICKAGQRIPNSSEVEYSLKYAIRARAQLDAELGNRLAGEGIFSKYVRVDNHDGTFLVDIVFNAATMKLLVDIDVDFYNRFDARRGDLCLNSA